MQGAGWKVVASFEGKFPTRIKQLPLDKHFDMKNVKRVILLYLSRNQSHQT
jgi:dynamin GTPase